MIPGFDEHASQSDSAGSPELNMYLGNVRANAEKAMILSRQAGALAEKSAQLSAFAKNKAAQLRGAYSYTGAVAAEPEASASTAER